MLTIKDLQAGQSASVSAVGGEGALRQHLLDMGLTPGAKVFLEKKAPSGDSVEIIVRDYPLALRSAESELVEVEETHESQQVQSDRIDADFSYNLSLHEHNAHPGYGEEGKYHSKDHAHALPKGTILTFAIAGRQNSGKTTLFNKLTGSNQHVGNFPGVTVDRKDSPIVGHPDTLVTDLPGIFSLSAFSQEERMAWDVILKDKPKAIINIVDVGNIERNLYLTIQLMELGIPMVLALNMMDEFHANGGVIRLNELERELGLPVVPIAAAKNQGITELIEHAIHTAKYQEAPARHDFCDPDDCSGAVHRCLHGIMALVESRALSAGLPARFVASRLIEGDESVCEALHLTDSERSAIENIVSVMEQERGMDRHAAMADMRFNFIHRLCKKIVKRPRETKELHRSRRMDSVLTGKWTALPSFIAIIALVFYLTFDVIGAGLQDLLCAGIDALGGAVSVVFERLSVSAPLRSLVLDAVFSGVGSVLSFVPIVVVLFFFLSILEDSGYMSRVAFVTDGMLRRLGLSGRSIVPMLIGFGCTVPAVMAARTLPSSHDRKLTIFMLPFMSCSAKIAIYGFFASSFFPGHAGIVMVSLYLLGIIVGIVVALISKAFRKDKEAAPLVMELPVYRLPVGRNVIHLLWDKTRDFIKNAFTVILVATVVIWFLKSFNFRLEYVSGAGSMLATIAGWIVPVMSPMGLGDWRIVTSLISGFLAKESVVATLQVLGATTVLNTVTAVPMLVFSLLYTPCVASIAAIRRELGLWWALFVIVFQCAVAWVCAYLAYLLFLI